jgi:hypothetical protein
MINDTRTSWLGRLVGALAALTPPNLGVVGPACAPGAGPTPDFTHQTHGLIFPVSPRYESSFSVKV